MGVTIKLADGTTWQASDPSKTCLGCKKPKPLTAYYKNCGTPDGRTYRCRSCRREQIKASNEILKAQDLELWKATVRVKSARYRQQNRETVRKQAREYSKRLPTLHPGIGRARALKAKYGLTEVDWDALFDAQGKQCAICETDTPGRSKKAQWHTDHDHKTGVVRGILCAHCNRMLGSALDDPWTLEAALEYLKKSKTKERV